MGAQWVCELESHTEQSAEFRTQQHMVTVASQRLHSLISGQMEARIGEDSEKFWNRRSEMETSVCATMCCFCEGCVNFKFYEEVCYHEKTRGGL